MTGNTLSNSFRFTKIIVIKRSYSSQPITEVSIHTIASTKLNFPAITVCREIPYNPDEYVRVIFDNFQMACNESSEGCEETQMLRNDFMDYLFLNDVIITHIHYL